MTGGVLWDLDGTLVDSAAHHWLAWRDTLEAEGRSVTLRAFAEGFGRRNDEILIAAFGPELAADWIARVSEAKEEAFRRRVREEGLDTLPGARLWLEHLHRLGWKQAVASSAPRPNIHCVLGCLALRPYLEAALSADDVGRGKPDPAIFLAAARALGLSPGLCVVVEDAPAGLEAARRAGMPSIGLLSAHHAELTADVVVASLEELPNDVFERLIDTPSAR